MTYGNATELWLVGERGAELKDYKITFESESAARCWAMENATRQKDYAVYRCELIGLVVIDDPRWIDHRPQASV